MTSIHLNRRPAPAAILAPFAIFLSFTAACGTGGSPPTSSTTTPSPSPTILTISGTVYADPDIITSADRTTFAGLTDEGMGRRRMFDRRINAFATFDVFLFRASFSDGLSTEIQVNAEFGTSALARLEAVKYATVVGRIPTTLRVQMQSMWIHRGFEALGGGNNNILIHTERAADDERRGALEEALFHEGTHTSLDARHQAATGWLEAQQRDADFISTYARDNPTREDVAESVLMWAALRQRPDRISRDLAATIQARMPNRLRYLDAEGIALSPM